jgi:hypothetical protein
MGEVGRAIGPTGLVGRAIADAPIAAAGTLAGAETGAAGREAESGRG